MPQYKVKSHISFGEKDKDGKLVEKQYLPGSKIELSEYEAYEIRHALEDAPGRPTREPSVVTAARQRMSEGSDDLEKLAEEQEELDEDEKGALDSIRRRPDNPDSGVLMHWKTDAGAVSLVPSQTLSVGHGFERAHGGLNPDPGGLTGMGFSSVTRPEANKTEMELEEEETIQEREKELQETAVRKAVPATPAPAAKPAAVTGGTKPVSPSK